MIPKIAKVMVVTDFSATADAAVPFAYAIVAPGGEVHLVHVIEQAPMPNPMYAHYSSDDLYDPAKRAEAIAQVESELGRRVPADTGGKSVATVLGAVVHPQVADGIISEAGDRAVDAVVMGSHGHGALFHLPMGSVAEAVFRQARMPVLIVPGQG